MAEEDAAQQRAHLESSGFVIIRNCVPPSLLPALRQQLSAVATESEVMMSGPTQPRISIDFAEPLSPSAVEFVRFCCSESVLGRSAALLGSGQIAVHQMQTFMNPAEEPTEPVPPPGQDFGTDPQNWHRDMRPDGNPPLDLTLHDHVNNDFPYLQWNIALEPERCLMVVPHSCAP